MCVCIHVHVFIYGDLQGLELFGRQTCGPFPGILNGTTSVFQTKRNHYFDSPANPAAKPKATKPRPSSRFPTEPLTRRL